MTSPGHEGRALPQSALVRSVIRSSLAGWDGLRHPRKGLVGHQRELLQAEQSRDASQGHTVDDGLDSPSRRPSLRVFRTKPNRFAALRQMRARPERL